MRGLPVLAGIIAFMAAAQRRLRPYWPLAGVALIDGLTGTLTVVALGTTGIGVDSSLLPLIPSSSDVFGPRDLTALAEGLWRAGGMLVFSLLAHRLPVAAWRRTRRQRGATTEAASR